MNSTIVLYSILTVLAVGFLIFIKTPAGKRWLDSLDD